MNPILHALLILSPLLASVAAIATWRRRRQPGIGALAGVCLATVIWGVTYYFEVLSSELPTKLFWAAVKYPAVAFIPVLVAIFFMRYAGQRNWPGRWLLFALSVVPVLTVILVFTNPLHSLFWSTVALQQHAGYNTLVVSRGPWFYILVAYGYGLILASGSAAISHLNRHLVADRRPVWLVALLMFVPVTCNILGLLGMQLFPGIDPSTFAFGVSGVLLLMLSRRRASILNPLMLAHSTLLAQMREGVIVLNQELRVLEINLAALRMLGLERQRLIGQPVDSLGSQAAELLRGRVLLGTFPVETQLDHPDGPRWFEVRVTPLLLNGAEIAGYMSVWHEITDRKHIELDLRHTSTHDQLTGLYNRLFFEEMLQRIRHDRHWPVTVLMLDLDNLKQANDTLGHAAGDEMIRRGAEVLQSALRQDDVVARIGGDEFSALLPGCSEARALQVVQRLQNTLSEHNAAVQPPISLSIGYAVARFGEELDEALKAADANMYADKSLHRGKPY